MINKKKIIIDFDDVLVPTQAIIANLLDLGIHELYYDKDISKADKVEELLSSGTFYTEHAHILNKDLTGFVKLLNDKRLDVYIVTAEHREAAQLDKKRFLQREFPMCDWDTHLICTLDKLQIDADFRLDDYEVYLTDSNSINVLYVTKRQIDMEFDHKVSSIADFYSYVVGSLGSKVTAYVDGSYNPSTGVYGSGVVYYEDNQPNNRDLIKFSGSDPSYVMSRQIPGEAMAAVYAVNRAIRENRDKITLIYDYEGLAKWVNGQWKNANSKIGKAYKNIMLGLMQKIEVEFIWVNSHTGVELNELADNLAKEACGV